MAENTRVIRSDLDILDDLHSLMATYPPINHNRDFIRVVVNEGAVVVSGNVQSKVMYHWIINTFPRVEGVRALSVDALFCDDDLRLEIGQLVPPGVFVNVNNGTVTLTGRLPQGMVDAELVQTVANVRGVRRIGTLFK